LANLPPQGLRIQVFSIRSRQLARPTIVIPESPALPFPWGAAGCAVAAPGPLANPTQGCA
jgi:hypothetical protein